MSSRPTSEAVEGAYPIYEDCVRRGVPINEHCLMRDRCAADAFSPEWGALRSVSGALRQAQRESGHSTLMPPALITFAHLLSSSRR